MKRKTKKAKKIKKPQDVPVPVVEIKPEDFQVKHDRLRSRRLGQGTRVRYEGSRDPDGYSPRKCGLEGTVTTVDDAGTVHMKWDDGSTLGILPGIDRYTVLKLESPTK